MMSEQKSINREEFIKRASMMLCRIRGVDPEAPVSQTPRPGADLGGQLLRADGKITVPMWKIMEQEVRNATDTQDALRMTVQEMVNDGVTEMTA